MVNPPCRSALVSALQGLDDWTDDGGNNGWCANESPSMRVSPATSFAPDNLVILTRVEPDADNRAIEVIADGEDFLSRQKNEGN